MIILNKNILQECMNKNEKRYTKNQFVACKIIILTNGNACLFTITAKIYSSDGNKTMYKS